MLLQIPTLVAENQMYKECTVKSVAEIKLISSKVVALQVDCKAWGCLIWSKSLLCLLRDLRGDTMTISWFCRRATPQQAKEEVEKNLKLTCEQCKA